MNAVQPFGTRKSFVVLMAEDGADDIMAIQRAWKKNNITNPLYVVNNGVECLDYLHRRGKFSDPHSAPRPDIILLDLKMPKMDGLTTLQRIREDKSLRRFPVIILTTSKLEEDRLKSYEYGANAYIRKPIRFSELLEITQKLNHFWELVELPE